MNKKIYGNYSLIVVISIVLIGIIPAYAENKNHGDKIPLSFVDSKKDPKYYVDRYYNEKEYRMWFDRNYPDYTIEEAVGYTDPKIMNQNSIKNKIFPEAQASSASSEQQQSENDELAQIVLAISALIILFGATYGIKKKVDDNSRQISINRNTIKQKIIKPIIGTDPFETLQIRLAKSEITLQEYREIKNELNTN